MSKVAKCPTCGGPSKIKESKGKTEYRAIVEEDMLKKIKKLKVGMQKYKEKAEKYKSELKSINKG